MLRKLLLIATGIGLRLYLLLSWWTSILESRIELATPLTSFKRVREGVFLQEIGVDPYSGWAYHASPFVLPLFNFLCKFPLLLHIFFIGLDLLAAQLVAACVRLVLARFPPTHSKEDVPPPAVLKLLPDIAYFAYFLHPYSILLCGGHSLAVLESLAIFSALYYCLRGNAPLAALNLALATHFSLHPAMLLVASVFFFPTLSQRVLLVALFLVGSAALLLAGYLITGAQWTFVHATWGLVLLLPDLTPNVGLFWYFFLETFAHYRAFFLAMMHGVTFAYTVPLALRLRARPVLLFWSVLSVAAVFKPYPTVGDITLSLCLLPTFFHFLRFMKLGFVIANTFMFVSFLGPVLYYLWVETGTGNSNFFYAVTLAYAIAASLLVSETIGLALQWDYTSKHRLSMFPSPAPPQPLSDERKTQ